MNPLIDMRLIGVDLNNEDGSIAQKIYKLNEKSNTEVQAWEVVDQLYNMETRTIDHNLHALHEYLKPQAQNIYYERKVEYLNLVDDNERANRYKMEIIQKKERRKMDNFMAEHKAR